MAGAQRLRHVLALGNGDGGHPGERDAILLEVGEVASAQRLLEGRADTKMIGFVAKLGPRVLTTRQEPGDGD